jgi:DNA-binding cell septation regulator SpoVG
MSININHNEYIFEDEELEEIEYLEIMSIDDIIKDNPSFIALSRDEIKSSLFELFANNKKANNITTLFYDIINDIDDNRGKLKNYDNYVFDAEAEKNDYSADIADKTEVANFNNLKKKTVINHDIAKEKYFFCIKYNNDSHKLRFKPNANINITIEPRDKDFPIYYPVFPADDVNIPILSAYYKIPKTVINDYLYTKITSHLTSTKNINYISSENCENVSELIRGVRPDINNIIEYLKDSFELDYYNIENVLNKFGKSLDFINKEDFSVLCDYLEDVMEQYKERKNVSRPVKIKKPDIINKKLIFFDKLNTCIQLLNLKDKVIDFLDKNKMSLEDYRENNIMTDKIKPLKDLRTYDIVEEIRYRGIGNYEDNEVILEVLDIIKHSLKNSNILEAIQSIDGILKTHEKFEVIVKKYEIARRENEYSRNHIFDYDKDGKQYLISYREHKDIKDSHYNDNNEGIPMIEFETADTDDTIDDNVANAGTGEVGGDIGYIIGFNELTKYDIEKYVTNINYKNELGFVDSLVNMLSIMNNIGKSANIDFDYDALCSELFKYNRSIPKRRDMYMKAFQDNGLEMSEDILNYLDKLSPKSILVLINNRDKPFSDIDDIAETVIVSYNKIWLEEFNDMFLNALAYCIINLQDKILNDTIFIDVDYLNGNFLSYWDNCGSPLNKKEDRGVMSYIIEVAADYLINNSNNEFLIETDNMFKRVYKIIDKYYSENLERMKKKDDICREKKKEQKGKIERDKLYGLYKNKECGKDLSLCREQYMKSLIYMPDVNYIKIHKFLNGCCLKKLDDSFNEDIDLKNANRPELIGFKKKYAEKKMINKPRDLRFIPKKTAKAHATDEGDVGDVGDVGETGYAEEIIERIYLDDYIYDMNNNSKIVKRWLEAMKGKNNSIFPDNIIRDFENGNIKSIKNNIISNVSLLTKTSKHSGDEFIDNFNNVRKINKTGKGGKGASVNDKIKYLNIIRAIIKTLYGYLRREDNKEEIKILLTNSIKDLRDIIIDLKELNKIYNDDIENEIDIINKYIVSRALCCPFNIDNVLNGNIISDIISSQYIYKITASVYEDVFKIIRITFPTLEENIDFLNKQREKNKQEKIKAFNKITVEENALIKELKKAGFKPEILEEKKDEEEINNLFDNVIEPDENNENNEFNDIFNDNAGGARQEINDENMLMTYDREDDDENMDTEDMGFLYN